MAQDFWAVICPENAAPGLWKTWLKERCVAIGWPPSHHHLRGATTKTSWRKARERALKVRRGDIIIPYLLPNRFGIPGKVIQVAIRDDEWKPTVPKGGYANNPTEPELGRRINLKWLSQGVPGANQIAVVPKNMRTAGGEVKQTIEFVRPKRREHFMKIISNPANWRLYGLSHRGGKPIGHTPEQAHKRHGSSSASREPDSAFGGNKLYVERARKAFPILVRQAKAGGKLYYSDLAGELEMPNPRNLNYVLGHIGREIQKLARRWKTEIPPIQCLVVNKSTGLPGEGIGWFISHLEDIKKRSPQVRKQILEIELVKVFNYRQWDEVLSAFGVEPIQPKPVIATLKSKAARYGGVGETEDHRRLKEYVARTPKILGLSGFGKGTTEFTFPSADRIDVMFQQGQEWVGVEVKGATSDDGDLVRGLFQCVKYIALLEANLKSDLKKGSVRVVLVSARKLPAPVRELRSILGVEVLEGIAFPT